MPLVSQSRRFCHGKFIKRFELESLDTQLNSTQQEVACGEHGEAVYKLVAATNNGRCKDYSQDNNVLLSVVQSNDKVMNSVVVASTSDVNPVIAHDSVIVDIDLVKNSSKCKPPNDCVSVSMSSSREQQEMVGPASSLLESSTESVIDKKDSHHINGFPTSSWTQFWILLKRTFLTIIRDQTLTQMRLVSHVVVGAIIG